jgi:YggT family protein
LRKLVQPIGGVDITPIILVAIFSFIREILLGQQGLLTMLYR